VCGQAGYRNGPARVTDTRFIRFRYPRSRQPRSAPAPRAARTAYRHDSIEPRYARSRADRAPITRHARSQAAARRAPNYDRRLTRRIVLDDGKRIMTLRDAADLFAERFATVKSWRLLELAIERLIAAAESAEREKETAAPDSIARVLRTRR